MPKPFHFKLQRVLDYRIQIEDRARHALALARHDYQMHLQYLEDLKDRLEAHLTSLADRKELTAADLWLWRTYRERLEMEIKIGGKKLKDLAAIVEKRRQEVIERSKDRKLLEKLKSNQALAFAVEEGRNEQRGFDEMATLRYGHNGV